jgi:hypothetical protein
MTQKMSDEQATFYKNFSFPTFFFVFCQFVQLISFLSENCQLKLLSESEEILGST